MAINPYKIYKELYSIDAINKYSNKPLGAEEPHVYAIADQAYRNLVKNKVNQSMVIT